MRLSAGGIRELHWHQAAEWAIMTYGTCRVTVLDTQGRPYVADVKAGDLWYFPPGAPHSLQGLGPDGCEFVICFDDGHASEFNTLLVTDWFAHTPPEVLAKNFGVPAEAFAKIPLHNLWIFQGTRARRSCRRPRGGRQECRSAALPVHLSARQLDAAEAERRRQPSASPTAPTSRSPRTSPPALVTVPPGGIREMHWHPNADEWQYYIKGKARMTVFNTGPNALTTDFRRRHRLCPAQSRALRREHRRYRVAVRRCVPRVPLRRGLALRTGWRIRRPNWSPSTSMWTKR